MRLRFNLCRLSSIPLLLLGVVACGAGRPAVPADAPTPAEPEKASVVVCGERLAATAEAVTCVGAGVVDLAGLRQLDRLTTLTLDDQSLPALWKLDDATLARLQDLTVEPVPLPRSIPFYQLTTRVVKAEPFSRLRGLRSLKLRVDLDDPKALRSLTKLRTLEASTTNLRDAGVVAEMAELSALNVSATSDLGPLRKLRSLEVLRGLGGQKGACEVVERNPGLRALAVRPAALACPGIARLPGLRDLTVFLPPDRADADAAIVAIAKLKRLRRLELFGDGATLSPLETLPNLVELESWMSALDIREVRGLRHLENLTWHGPGRAEHLAGLTHLRELHWDHPRSDWTGGPALSALEVLETFAYGEVARLASSPRLREAMLGTVRGDLTVLARLTGLRTLSMKLSEPADLSALAALRKLEKLRLHQYDGALGWLEGKPKLRELTVTGSAPRMATLPASLSLDRLEVRGSLGPTIALPALRVKMLILESRRAYRAGSNHREPVEPTVSLSGIERVRGLEELVFEGSSVRSLKPLEGQEGLRRIEISGAPVVSLEPLRGKPLREVDVSSTLVTDLGPLADASRLSRLSVSNTTLDDLRPVARLPSLVMLDASSTPMSHLGQLVAMGSLYYLDVADTGVRDVSPLAERPSLRFLSAPAAATNFAPLAGLPLLAVTAPRFDCASKDAVPFTQIGMSLPSCTAKEDLDEADPHMADDEDSFDEPWRGP